ncbi:hypothetical protein D7M15_12725 [Streptomyces sp. Z26]|nr:hypothetical protein D7M15_12725 [Streptomyces sp. Z26]
MRVGGGVHGAAGRDARTGARRGPVRAGRPAAGVGAAARRERRRGRARRRGGGTFPRGRGR